MADEASNITLLGNSGDVVEFTVAATTAIPKNTLMYLATSPMTVLATSAEGQHFMGIASTEKTATDGITKMGLITHCIADLTCGAAETMVLGAPVKTGAAANEVDVADESAVEGSSEIVGIAQETVAGNGSGAVLISVGRQR